MKYWKHVETGEIIEADTSPDNGWLWIEIFCIGLDPLRCDAPQCPVHGEGVKK